jgi:hypothetical protein
VRIVPQDPDTEEEFRADIKTMYENLPPHLKPATKYYSDELIEIKDTVKGTINSRITTASVPPGHEAKGRGQTITDLHLTEVSILAMRSAESSDDFAGSCPGRSGLDRIDTVRYRPDARDLQPGQKRRGRLDEFLFRMVVEEIVPDTGCTIRPGTKERMDPSAPGRNAERRLAGSGRRDLRGETGR